MHHSFCTLYYSVIPTRFVNRCTRTYRNPLKLHAAAEVNIKVNLANIKKPTGT